MLRLRPEGPVMSSKTLFMIGLIAVFAIIVSVVCAL